MSTFLDFPVYGGRITSGYGWRIHPVSKGLAFHTGLDIGPPTPGQKGVLVFTSAYGKVTSAGDTGGAYGKQVIIAHDKGVDTSYSHLADIRVTKGETVRSGQVIGIMGDTGSTVKGIHLHYETWVWGVRVNPLAALGREGYRNIAGHVENIPVEAIRRAIDGKVFVEARAVAELLGGTVDWNEEDEIVTIEAAIIKLAEQILKRKGDISSAS
jgi:hypothetical protein